MSDPNARFVGSIPASYDRFLGPMLFEPYADDLVRRLEFKARSAVLELAAGTGIVTKRLRRAMPPTARLTATDLNQPMLDIAQAKVTSAGIQWQVADAHAIPFPDASFDTVVCQFGIMFFPDKLQACREVRRVLKPGGLFAFSVWGSLDDNPLGRIAKATVNRFFTADPPTFFDVPFGFSDEPTIRALLKDASFDRVSVERVRKVGQSPTALDATRGIIGGNPTLMAIQERATGTPEQVIDAAARALAREFGDHPLRVPTVALVIQARAA
jgi:ubiquinone/menaquinone biosynthesis C-methylase UbiE